MGRQKGRILKDQREKIEFVATYLGFSKDLQWQEAINVQNTTISNWRAEKPISEDNLVRLVEIINEKNGEPIISADDLVSLSLEALCSKLEVSFSSDNANVKLFVNRTLMPHDISTMRAIRGRYHAIYLAHDLETGDQHLDCEVIQFGSFDEERKLVSAWQEKNKTTGSKAEGVFRITNERAICVLQWEELYPESVYHLLVVPFGANRHAFYGIYLDVNAAPVKDIFAARVMILPFIDDIGESRRLERTSRIFEIVEQLLKDEGIQKDRKRFVVSANAKTIDMYKHALKQIYGGDVK